MNWHLQKIAIRLLVTVALVYLNLHASVPSFGPNGYVTSDISSEELNFPSTFFGAAQANGYYYAAGLTKGGNGILNRYSSTGALDITVINTNVSLWYGAANGSGVVVVVGQNNAGSGIMTRYIAGTASNAGALDTTFGTNGSVVNTGVSSWYAVTIDSNNSIIVAGTTNSGYGIVARYTSAGNLDTTFNSTGYVISTSANTNAAAWYAVTLDNYNSGTYNVIVAGQTNTSYGVVARYTSAGALDTNFNSVGYKISASTDTNAGQWTCVGYGLDGANNAAPVIVVAGVTRSGQAVVACYNAPATSASGLYTTFNNSGYVTSTSADTKATTWSTLAIDTYNNAFKIAVAGTTSTGYGVVAQYLHNGALNSGTGGFTSSGYVISANTDTNTQQWYGVVYDSETNIVPVGTSHTGYGIIAWYTPEGALADFNNNTGYNTPTPITTYATSWNSIGLDSNNNYVVGGASNTGYGMIARYTDAGNLDATFNPGGSIPGAVVINGLGSSSPITLNAIAVDSKNNVVGVGTTSGSNAVVVRYTSTGALDTANFNAPHGYITSTLAPSWADVAIDGLGNVVVVGATSSGDAGDGIVARYTPFGLLDTANFNPNAVSGGRGYATNTQSNEFYSVAIDSSNNIFVTSIYVLDIVYGEIFMYSGTGNSAGQVNTSFNVSYLNDVNLNSIALDSNGNIIVAGEINANNSWLRAYAPLNSTSINSQNVENFNRSLSNFPELCWLSVTTYGSYVVVSGGGSLSSYTDAPSLARYTGVVSNAPGALDTTFNGTGLISSFSTTGPSVWNGVIVDQNYNVVVAGTTLGGQGIIASYYNNGTLASPGNFSSTTWAQQNKAAGVSSGVL